MPKSLDELETAGKEYGIALVRRGPETLDEDNLWDTLAALDHSYRSTAESIPGLSDYTIVVGQRTQAYDWLDCPACDGDGCEACNESGLQPGDPIPGIFDHLFGWRATTRANE